MSECRRQVEDAVRATVFHSHTVFSWFGKRIPQLPAKTRAALTQEALRNNLRVTLGLRLYSNFYCKGVATPQRPNEALFQNPVDAAPFVKQLREANWGAGYWDDGWSVVSAAEDDIVVSRAGRTFRVSRADCDAGQEQPIAAGTLISVRFPKELPSVSPGFYMAVHKRPKGSDGNAIVRVYWNPTPEGAIRLMRDITAALGQADLAFRFKVSTELSSFSRCDAAVLYFSKGDYPAVLETLEQIFPRAADSLRSRTPVFTKRLARGVGLAEDPGENRSFGEHRCRILAEGMISVREQGAKSLADRMALVCRHFAGQGVDLEKPFLNPGSDDAYEFEPRPRRQVGVPRPSEKPPSRLPQTDSYLRTAHAIGSRLCREAFWHRNQCNWMAKNVESEEASYQALGPELYDGSAGVALFLAELYAATGDIASARTARAAVRHALSKAASVEPPRSFGLYTGSIGIAFAAARIGAVTRDDELLEGARKLLQRCSENHDSEHDLDVISGTAGAIPALLMLGDSLGQGSLLDFARRLGDDLLDKAVAVEDAYCWKTAGTPNNRYLTGFSHGNAGIGWALLELFEATADDRYRRAAQRAFDYERRWFDPGAGNWPDFREVAPWRKGSRPHLPFMTAWCHGAPGIVLSRLRGYRILKDERCKQEALAGLQTTQAALETALGSKPESFSLCHGLGGNAEVLLLSREILGNECRGNPEVAFQIADWGISTYADEGDWPCGTARPTPSLMLGLAGIGYFYLRIANPATPSVLLLSAIADREAPGIPGMQPRNAIRSAHQVGICPAC